MKIEIRKATPKDRRFIALVMAEAIGDSIMERISKGISTADMLRLTLLESVATRTDTLYSWNNTIIAEGENGEPLGALIAYPGKDYKKLRETTFDLLKEIITFDITTMDDETKPGEYYLDSLAVLPQFRNKGIGKSLLIKGIEKAKSLAMPCVLACDPENNTGKALYLRMGFRQDGEMFIFGKKYLKMTIGLQKENHKSEISQTR